MVVVGIHPAAHGELGQREVVRALALPDAGGAPVEEAGDVAHRLQHPTTDDDPAFFGGPRPHDVQSCGRMLDHQHGDAALRVLGHGEAHVPQPRALEPLVEVPEKGALDGLERLRRVEGQRVEADGHARDSTARRVEAPAPLGQVLAGT